MAAVFIVPGGLQNILKFRGGLYKINLVPFPSPVKFEYKRKIKRRRCGKTAIVFGKCIEIQIGFGSWMRDIFFLK